MRSGKGSHAIWFSTVSRRHFPVAANIKSRHTANEILKHAEGVLSRAADGLSAIERVKRFAIAAEPFSIENGELTPTIKIRRHAIVARYREILEALY